MQINKSKSKKPKLRQAHNTLFDDDLASGFEDSKLDKFKPALKVLAVVIVLMSTVWGAVAYFGGTDTKNNADKDYTANTAQRVDDSDSKLSRCIADAAAKNPTPDTSDANFYPKLISGYDAQLACYDKYPEANGAVSRSSIEYARDNALDSSGDYKNTYASSSGGSSSKNSVTGCDYSLSESEYLACSDKYYAAHSSPSSTPSSNTGGASTPSYTSPSTTSTPRSPSGGSSSSSSSSVADRTYWQNKCEEQVRQQSGGTSLTASQRAVMVGQCMASHGY